MSRRAWAVGLWTRLLRLDTKLKPSEKKLQVLEQDQGERTGENSAINTSTGRIKKVIPLLPDSIDHPTLEAPVHALVLDFHDYRSADMLHMQRPWSFVATFLCGLRMQLHMEVGDVSLQLQFVVNNRDWSPVNIKNGMLAVTPTHFCGSRPDVWLFTDSHAVDAGQHVDAFAQQTKDAVLWSGGPFHFLWHSAWLS